MRTRRSKFANAAGAACRPRRGENPAAWIARRLQQGLAWHHGGHLAKAEAAYREVLAAHPDHPDALHLLGLLASETGAHELGLELIAASIRAQPEAAHLHASLGLVASRQGDWRRAVSAYCRSLELDPENPRALVELGRMLEQQGQAGGALQAYREAQRLDPRYVEAIRREAFLLCRIGRQEEAALRYRQAIEYDPRDWQAHHELANLLYLAGRFEEAELHYRAALPSNPERAEAHYGLGLALARAGKWQAAAAELAVVVQQKPGHCEAWHEYGNALHCTGRLDDAIQAYRRALESRPERSETHFNLGVTLSRRRLFDAAIECYRRAIELRPDYAEAHNNLANLMQLHGRMKEAIDGYDRAILAAPAWSAARYNRALALQEQGRLEEVAAAYRDVLAADPRHAEAANNLGNTLLALRRPGEAIASYQMAIGLADPGSAPELVRQAHWNLALAQLVTGDLREGWKGYEWRLRGNPNAAHFSKPGWSGEPFAHRKLLVWSEQGLGDAVQFARYLEMVKKLGGDVLFECRPEMAGLMRDSELAGKVVERGSPLPDHHLQVPLMSLPRLLGGGLEDIPDRVPYLRVRPESLTRWAARVAHRQLRRVGLVWAGNPAHQNDRNRSMTFADLDPLAGLPGIAWYSLQKGGQGSECDLGSWHGELDQLGPELGDMRDTAAVLLSLDLVISVDTMVAHLAGALARPVWTMLPYAPDWRWLLDREDSPWYPTMRLFRQPAPGDWASVVEQVRQALLVGC